MENKKEKNTERIEARVTPAEKKSLLMIARDKGCSGMTGLLKLLAKAKNITIEIKKPCHKNAPKKR